MSKPNYRVHDFQHLPNAQARLRGVHPYQRIVQQGQPTIIVQEGRFFYDGEDGEEIPRNEVPAHVWEHLANVTQDYLKVLGIDLSQKASEEPSDDVPNSNSEDGDKKEPLSKAAPKTSAVKGAK